MRNHSVLLIGASYGCKHIEDRSILFIIVLQDKKPYVDCSPIVKDAI